MEKTNKCLVRFVCTGNSNTCTFCKRDFTGVCKDYYSGYCSNKQAHLKALEDEGLNYEPKLEVCNCEKAIEQKYVAICSNCGRALEIHRDSFPEDIKHVPQVVGEWVKRSPNPDGTFEVTKEELMELNGLLDDGNGYVVIKVREQGTACYTKEIGGYIKAIRWILERFNLGGK